MNSHVKNKICPKLKREPGDKNLRFDGSKTQTKYYELQSSEDKGTRKVGQKYDGTMKLGQKYRRSIFRIK